MNRLLLMATFVEWYEGVDRTVDPQIDRPLSAIFCNFYPNFLLELGLEVMPIASC